jgi:cytochrome oxidase Cu insertion factor (SCO1/SenC/PrrC family)
MKNIALVLAFAFWFVTVFAQQEDLPYKQNKNIPLFTLEQPDKAIFSSSKLKKTQPTIIMFFSPGCDHCIHQFEDMVKGMKSLKSAQIVMATYQPLEELVEFNKKYQIAAKYPNIVTGRDANYFLPPFYHITNFPYFAFYDKTGKFRSVYEGNLSVANILKRIN